jgi:hypothetical protein
MGKMGAAGWFGTLIKTGQNTLQPSKAGVEHGARVRLASAGKLVRSSVLKSPCQIKTGSA